MASRMMACSFPGIWTVVMAAQEPGFADRRPPTIPDARRARHPDQPGRMRGQTVMRIPSPHYARP